MHSILFFTTKPLGSGTGLGLSMIYGFAKQSGGQARIYSELGRGAMVCLYFPRSLIDREVVSIIDPGVVPQAAPGKAALVVDDEALVRMVVVDVAEELGYLSLEAVDAAAGLIILQSSARISLLVTDIGLPGMNGWQLADAARALRPELKVLFITGYAENAGMHDAQLDIGMQILTKPFALEALGSKISEMMQDS